VAPAQKLGGVPLLELSEEELELVEPDPPDPVGS